MKYVEENPETIFYLDIKWQDFNKTFKDKGDV